MIRREFYLEQINDVMDSDFVKVFIGIRRCGKTELMLSTIDELKQKGIKDENIIYISLEDRKYYDIYDYKQLDEIIYSLAENSTEKIYIFIDEIQQVDKWEKSINGYRKSLNCDIYITGSNSKLLSTELSTYLAGRYIEIKVYPFSYTEVIQFKLLEGLTINEKEIFNEYVTYGGMPGLLAVNEKMKTNALRDIYNSIIVDDILTRHRIEKVDLFKRFIRYLMNSTSQTFSKKSIQNYLKNENIKMNPETINNYTDYLQEALFIARLRRKDLVGKKEMKTQEKYYLTDHGFHQALIDDNSKWIPRILENIVYMELLRRGYDVRVGKVYDREVDFEYKKDNQKRYMQVTYMLSTDETIEREFTPLEMIRDNYPKYVLSLDEFDMSRNGIIHMNIIDFLKNKEI
ncbi:ATP-binding protein [Methanosphaera sp. BMS]|uniref:ATP-binding protein n=1 Tax=Methanosphaera sp. BMS TaxID=1789762 RepID=UPI000DC1DD5E|nr:ATP-binding protein [Methanosphaera sp. BMS]AWX31867.1 ATPase [Methanosphaera sp. BMS]